MHDIHLVCWVIRNKSTGTFFTNSAIYPYTNWLQNAMLFNNQGAMRAVLDELSDDHEILIVHADKLRIHAVAE